MMMQPPPLPNGGVPRCRPGHCISPVGADSASAHLFGCIGPVTVTVTVGADEAICFSVSVAAHLQEGVGDAADVVLGRHACLQQAAQHLAQRRHLRTVLGNQAAVGFDDLHAWRKRPTGQPGTAARPRAQPFSSRMA